MQILRQAIAWDHPTIIAQMKDIGIESAQTANFDQMFELLARINRMQGREDIRPNAARYRKALQERNRQWDAVILLLALMHTIAARDDVVYLGITEADLFTKDKRFLFELAVPGSQFALLSYGRYRHHFHRERESQPRFLDRIHKQLLFSSGFALGIPRPNDPRTARSHPRSLEDHDLKGTWLSPECIEGFEKALGQRLPDQTREASLNQMR